MKSRNRRTPASASLVLGLAFALSIPLGAHPQARSHAQERDHLELERDVVNVTVSVMDSHTRHVAGIDRSRFQIWDNGVPQRIAFFSDGDTPATIGIVYDVSESMAGYMSRSLESFRSFNEMGHAEDEYFLISFNQRAHITRDFTRRVDTIAEMLEAAEPSGRTALYDAVYLGVDKARRGRHHKRALLVISDGADNFSRYKPTDVRDLVREADVQLYSIGVGGSSLTITGMALLEEIAKESGGRAFFPRDYEELADACAAIALELRSQYSIGYYPTDTARDGKWHEIKVRVAPDRSQPKLKVRAKKGYYAAKR